MRDSYPERVIQILIVVLSLLLLVLVSIIVTSILRQSEGRVSVATPESAAPTVTVTDTAQIPIVTQGAEYPIEILTPRSTFTPTFTPPEPATQAPMATTLPTEFSTTFTETKAPLAETTMPTPTITTTPTATDLPTTTSTPTSTLPPVPTASATSTQTAIPPPILAGDDELGGCEPQIYVVQAGDTLTSIALRFETRVESLVAVNNLLDLDRMQIGQQLQISCVDDLNSTGLVENTSAPMMKPTPVVLGYSVAGRPIELYQFGNGETRVALIGGIHGGYEWNTVLLSYQIIDHFELHPDQIPENISLYIVPAANPDGLALVVGNGGRFHPSQVTGDTRIGRFNANSVDLNRNWDCNWNPQALWGTHSVSGGTEPFSEEENRLLRQLLTNPPMDAVVFWHSALPGVIAAGCGSTFAPALDLAETYATAAQYPLLATFDLYETTGDATDWLATQSIPAITVELTNHNTLDWEQNLAGVFAILNKFEE